MSHTIRNQYDLLAGSETLESDFKAMLDWLSYWEMKPCTSIYFGEEVNAILVNNWISFRNSLSNIPKIYEREFLEACAREECEPDDFYEIEDCMDEIADGQLMAIGRLFYTTDMVKKIDPEPITSIAVKWGIEDIQSIRPDLTDEQASTVLQAADRCHDAEIGINWDVLRFHADDLFPSPEIFTIDEWMSRCKLIPNSLVENASFDGYMFETYGAELERVLQAPNNCIWTYQDDDNGNPCVTSGYHLVNRIGYFISEEPWETETYITFDFDSDEEDLDSEE